MTGSYLTGVMQMPGHLKMSSDWQQIRRQINGALFLPLQVFYLGCSKKRLQTAKCPMKLSVCLSDCTMYLTANFLTRWITM